MAAPALNLGASAVERWFTCKASPRFLVDNDHRLDKTPRDYTDAGSLAHSWAEKVLRGEAEVDDIADEQMRDNVRGYVKFCLDQTLPGDERGIEEAVELFYMRGRRGIIDYCLVRADGDLVIIDYKNGHTPVTAQGNMQLAIYALSKLKLMRASGNVKKDVDPKVTIIIYQPNTPGAPADIWETCESELLPLRDEIQAVADEILLADYDEDLPFAPSEEACRWCPARSFCTARGGQALELVPDMTITTAADMPLPDPKTFSIEQLLTFKRRKKEFLSFVQDADEHIDKLILVDGLEVPGLKVVLGREGNREWTSESEAETLLYPKLKAASYKPKALISVTEAEKRVKGMKLSTRFKNRWDELVTRSAAKPVVALEDDKRPSIKGELTSAMPDLSILAMLD